MSCQPPKYPNETMPECLGRFRAWAKTLNVPGYHLHFLSTDHKNGGHLLQCRGSNLRLQIQRGGEYRLALPETEDFLKADLRRDPAADLARAEGERK